MAAFTEPQAAVKAAVDMLREIGTFNMRLPERELILKIGVHRGASIAVTLNDRLDYFGQTVNIAARVQALADANEICLSQDVYEAPGVADLLRSFVVEPRLAHLRGVHQEMPVFRVASRRVAGRYAAGG